MLAVNSIRKSKYLLSWPRFCKIRKTWSFHVVVWQRTATKCTKIDNARAQLLFCSLNPLFGDFPVDVAVVVCLSSLCVATRVSGSKVQNLIERFSFECRKVIGFACTTLRDWLKRFAPLFHPIRSKTETNCVIAPRALRQLHVITSSFDWFTVLSVFFVIG